MLWESIGVYGNVWGFMGVWINMSMRVLMNTMRVRACPWESMDV